MSPLRFALIGTLAALDDTIAWFYEISDGNAVISANSIGPRPVIDYGMYSAGGGLGPWPDNSQRLAAEVTSSFGEIVESTVVIAVPGDCGVLPHAWRFRSGGLRVGPRQWIRRYAIIPENAPLGIVAHELGHLLFGWPDLGRRSSVGDDCLMAFGGHLHPPTRPCAPLRTTAQWGEPRRATRLTSVGDLGTAAYSTSEVLVELGCGGRVLIWQNTDDVRLLARIDAPPERRLLSLVAESRAVLPGGRGVGTQH